MIFVISATSIFYFFTCLAIGGKLRNIFKNYDSLWLKSEFTVIIRDPDDIKTVLNSEETFEKPSHARVILDSGLIPDGGYKYKVQRKALIPFLSGSALLKKLPIFNEEMDIFLENFAGQLEGKYIDAYDISMKMSNLASVRTLFDPSAKLNETDIDKLKKLPDMYVKSSVFIYLCIFFFISIAVSDVK